MKGQQSYSSHMISQQKLDHNKVERTFVFQKEQTHQSLLIDIKLDLSEITVDLHQLFQQYCPLKENKISIYDPQLNSFILLSKIGAQNTGKIPINFLQPGIIMVRFKRKTEDTQNTQSDSGVQSGLEQGRQKKDRSKQRTIGESIQIVKQWRALHLATVKSGMKKMSLSEAAKAIGISKKSLDDYYYQLRLGEFYNFDFANNLDEKIGLLRAYVKQFKPQRDQKNKNLRHPKNLKIIESFDADVPNILKQPLVPQVPLSPMLEQLKSPSSFKSLSLDQQSMQNFQQKCNPFLSDVMSSYEDKFFKNFQFLLDDPNDPFIEITHNFKKKTAQSQNTDFYFF